MLGPLTYLDARTDRRRASSPGCWPCTAASRARCCRSCPGPSPRGAVLYFVVYPQAVRARTWRSRWARRSPIAQIVVGAVIFLIVLIVVHLITARISDAILDSRIGMIDRILGFLFGVAARLRADRHPLHVLRGVLPRAEARTSPGCARPSRCPTSRAPAIRSASCWNRYMPSSLTAPPGEQPPEEAPVQPQQQGALENPSSDELALEAREIYHISVTWQVRAS